LKEKKENDDNSERHPTSLEKNRSILNQLLQLEFEKRWKEALVIRVSYEAFFLELLSA